MSTYIGLATGELAKKSKALMSLWNEFIPSYAKRVDKYNEGAAHFEDTTDFSNVYQVNSVLIHEVFERVHQREDYFLRYHKDLKMSNFKEMGLIAFWLTKLKPFSIGLKEFGEFFAAKVNEEFALFFLFNAVVQYAKREQKVVDINKCSPELYNELLYTMQYRDLAKEAYGCIAELLYIAILK